MEQISEVVIMLVAGVLYSFYNLLSFKKAKKSDSQTT